MKCPFCGAPSEVLSTRKGCRGSLVRRRECMNMHRFTTDEIVREDNRSSNDPTKTAGALASEHAELD